METILDMARADDRTHLVVSVITDGNEASQRLHDKFGFTFCGIVPEVGMKFESAIRTSATMRCWSNHARIVARYAHS